jgi:hypothetical protein
MRAAKPNGSTEIGSSLEIESSLEKDIGRNIHELTRTSTAFRQSKNGDGEMSPDDLGALLSRVSEGSTREIENLIDELHGLRRKLETEGSRIQSDIARYAELSQGVMQLTIIISDNVKKLPGAPGITG